MIYILAIYLSGVCLDTFAVYQYFCNCGGKPWETVPVSLAIAALWPVFAFCYFTGIMKSEDIYEFIDQYIERYLRIPL